MIDVMFDFLSHYVYDLDRMDFIFAIRTIAIVATSICLMFSNRQMYLTIDAAIQIVMSVMTICFPKFFLNMMVKYNILLNYN